MRTEDDIIKQWKNEGQKGRDILVELWNHQTTFNKYKSRRQPHEVEFKE